MTLSPTKALAAFVTGLRLEDIPAEVQRHAKRCILDTVCCGLFGTLRPEGQAIIRTLKAVMTAPGPAGVWGTDLKTDPCYAALANGIMVQSFTMDDLHNGSIIHTGSVTVPAALSVSAMLLKVSGRNLLTAIIAGFETVIRSGLGISPSARVRGHHPTGICGPFGATAAAGKLLGLSEPEMLSALGNAGSQGAGLMSAQFGFMTQRLHAGKAGHSGVLAALLASRGFSGTNNILEAEYGGFCQTFADEWNLENITAGLGDRYETLNIGLRPYACAGSVCTTVDAVKELKAKHKINPEDVKEVIVTCNHSIALHCGWEYQPSNVITAQMNIPFGAAVTLLEGDASVQQYTEEKVHSAEIVDMAGKVRVVHDPELDAKGKSHAYYVRVQVNTVEGPEYMMEVYSAKGTPANPLSDIEIGTKCHALADDVIGSTKVDQLVDLINNLEQLEEVSLLFKLISRT